MDLVTGIIYAVYISQIGVLSIFCPITYRKDMWHFIELHPETEYPHMYYASRADLERVITNSTNFKLLIGFIALIGLLLGIANVFTNIGLLQFMTFTLSLHIVSTFYLSRWLKRSVIPVIKTLKKPIQRIASLQSLPLTYFIQPTFASVTVCVMLGSLVYALYSFADISSNLWRGLLTFFSVFSVFVGGHGVYIARKLLVKSRIDPFENNADIHRRTQVLIKLIMGRSCFLGFVTILVAMAGQGKFSDITPWALSLLFSLFGQTIALVGVYSTKRIIKQNDYSGYRKDVVLAG
jgi:hypothetical protein